MGVEILVVHVLTHELPILVIAGVSFFFGRKAVFRYVRKRDPYVQELRSAAANAILHVDRPEIAHRLEEAVDAIEEHEECDHG